MTINYIICAAGKGDRFKKLMPKLSKPLIKLNSKTSLEISIACLPITFGDSITIIVQREHDVKNKLEKTISDSYPFNQINWIEIDSYTSGQLKTSFLAKDFVKENEAIAIFNCDTYFQDRSLFELMNNNKVDGLIPCFKANGDSWSFCKVDDKNKVLEVAEKVRISEFASVGFYYFKNSKLFFELAKDELKNDGEQGEHYVIPLYKKYITAGKKILISEVDNFKPMGTPGQLEEFWGINEKNLLDKNQLTNHTKRVIVCDLDNTITIEKSGVPYSEKEPNHKVIEKLREYKLKGYEIIINTSRRMKTHNNNEAKALAEVGEATLAWLKRFDVPFDGLKFGKPFAENGFIIDDKAIRPSEFLDFEEEKILKMTNS